MKKIMIALALMMTTIAGVEGHPHFNNRFSITVQTFYDELMPYGEWINTPGYGFAWRPYLAYGEDFRPYYSGGNWVYTDYGWTWVSDYRWGWATFHYGRWFYDDYLGWMWLPGNEWAPAWVTWGSYGDNWAWAPMAPGIHVNIRVDWYPPHFWWTFVPRHHFCSGNWYNHCYTPQVHITNINYITNVYYDGNERTGNGNWYYGPRVHEVEKHAGKRVQKMRVIETGNRQDLAARNGRVGVYRPKVKNERSDQKPRAYRTAENVRTTGATTDPLRQRTTVEHKLEQARPDKETGEVKQEIRNSVDRAMTRQPIRRQNPDRQTTGAGDRHDLTPATRTSDPVNVQGRTGHSNTNQGTGIETGKTRSRANEISGFTRVNKTSDSPVVSNTGSRNSRPEPAVRHSGASNNLPEAAGRNANTLQNHTGSTTGRQKEQKTIGTSEARSSVKQQPLRN